MMQIAPQQRQGGENDIDAAGEFDFGEEFRVEEKQPFHGTYTNYGQRVVHPIQWQDYVIPLNEIRGIVDDRLLSSEMPDYIGYIRSSGRNKTVRLPTIVVNAMLEWWSHRPGGYSKENFDLSVIYLRNISRTLAIPSQMMLRVITYVPVVAVRIKFDKNARLAMEDVSWKSWAFRNKVIILKGAAASLATISVGVLGFRIRNNVANRSS